MDVWQECTCVSVLPEDNLRGGAASRVLSTSFCKAGSLTGLGLTKWALGWLASELQGTGVTSRYHHSWLYIFI